MKNTGFGFGHLKARLFTIETSEHVGLRGPMVYSKGMYDNVYVNYLLFG